MIGWAAVLLSGLLACDAGQAPPAAPVAGGAPHPGAPTNAAPPGGLPAVDQKQQHPPLPADNPAWAWEAGGFVPDFGWYGEHSWDDVRMRVAGHISVAGRDLARLHAMQGDHAGCADAYRDLSGRLQAIPDPAAPGVAAEIIGMLREAAARDAALCAALAEGEAPPVSGEGLAALRARVLGLQVGEGAGEGSAAEARAIQAALKPFLEPRPDLDLDTFRDFDDRHRLRVQLFEAYLDSLDPLTVSEPWGYWEPAGVQEAAHQLGVRAAALGGQPWEAPPSTPPRGFTVEGLGALPTGDSLIDVAAQPGPRAIGSLEKLGLDDPAHRAWLEERAAALNAALAADPAAIPAMTAEMTTRIDAMGHGSRYYNIKQIRNEAVRRLASHDHPTLALQVLSASWPLHAQDWACPNREGILRSIQGRLQLQAGLPDAEATLRQALADADAFLADVAAAERGEAVGRRPPGMGRQQGPPGGPPGGAHNGPPGGPPGGAGNGPPGPPPTP